uniref:PDZ domain containing 3b n=1 Tax=Neogobius melanostomus TaxID=47308 RepID=A0A8C6TQM4_9GOBI
MGWTMGRPKFLNMAACKDTPLSGPGGNVDDNLKRFFSFNAKEGIDNPAMVITDDTDSGTTAHPRLCVLKREEGESYGFYLRMEKEQPGHIIRKVAPGGIAAYSGLRDGDRLLEVNCCFVDDISHQEVTMKIKLSGNQLSLLVLSEEEYRLCKSKEYDFKKLPMVNKSECCKPPRLCHITKNPGSGLGIAFAPVEGQKGHFTVNLVAGGAAEKAGVFKGDRLVWMSGAIVEDLSHSAISTMLKKCGSQITILVVDAESEKYYNSQGIPILPAMATTHNLPYTARKLHLLPGKDGYGFLLHLERSPSGRVAYVLREMVSGGPAEKAGMRAGDLLLEVNGEAVEGLKHEEITDRVRQSGQEVTLTTITPEGLDFYTKLGLSPLLFCEEVMVTKQDGSVQATLINEKTDQNQSVTAACSHEEEDDETTHL